MLLLDNTYWQYRQLYLLAFLLHSGATHGGYIVHDRLLETKERSNRNRGCTRMQRIAMDENLRSGIVNALYSLINDVNINININMV